MRTTIKPYQPNFKKILEHSKSPEPLMFSPEEYEDILIEYGLRRGTRLSDVGILKAMEAGLIKIWDPDGNFDLEKAIQPCYVDLRLGKDFWFYKSHQISRLTLGKHLEPIQNIAGEGLLEYSYKLEGDEFVFHPGGLVLALLQEGLAVSNCAVGTLDGRSLAGRLGLSNHQTAGTFEPGFSGRMVLEISNTNNLDIAVPILERIGAISFMLLDQPSTRPRNFKSDKDSQSKANNQISPFGFWLPEWDNIRKKSLAQKAKTFENGVYFAQAHELKIKRKKK